MFSIRCPGCGKEHFLAEAVETPFKKRCLRCTESFQVTAEMARAVDGVLAQTTAGVQNTGAGPVDESGAGEESSQRIGLGDAEDISAESESPKRARKKRAGKGQRKPDAEASSFEEEAGDAQTEEDAEEGTPPSSRRPLWPLVSLLTLGGLLAAGAAWYLLAGQGNAVTKHPTGNTAVAESSAKPEPPKSLGKAAAATDPGALPPPAPVGPPAPAAPATPAQKLAPVKLSAPRLAVELAADSEAAKRKYATRTLQVSGLFDRLEGTDPPVALFACDEGRAVGCDLAGLSLAARHPWSALLKGKPFTVQGELGKDLRLHGCELLPLAAPADDRYLGKEIEVVGYVAELVPTRDEREYPMLKLEHDTNARTELECLFRRADEPEVKKIKVGTPVTLSAVCSGRSGQGPYSVRLDNCRLIYTTAPAPPTLRLEAAQLLRDYEEDLRTALLPTQPTALALSAAQLDREFAADRKSLQKKYSNKIITVTGSLYKKAPPVLVLETGTTNQSLKIQCYFTPQNFRDLDDRKEFTIRGLCSGVTNAQMLRLDNCQLFDASAPVDTRSLAVDYLPCKPGQVLTYDVAALPPDGVGPPVVVRRVFSFLEGGVIPTLTTHTARLPTGSRLSDSLQLKNWISSKKTQRVYIEGPVFRYRLSGGFIEIGQQSTSPDGTAVDWQPILKLGSKTGESWKWKQGSTQHEFTLVKFAEHKGRSSAVVKEAVANVVQPERYQEIQHVYVRDVGEVERQEFLRLPGGQMRVISVMRLVEDEDLAPPEKPGTRARTANIRVDVKKSKPMP